MSGEELIMKQASFVMSIVALCISTLTLAAVAWLYIEKKVRYITTDDNVQ